MKYYCVRQHDETDCGPACIATICCQLGSTVGIGRVREVACTDTNGTSLYNMVRAAESLGFSAYGVKGSEESLHEEIPLPCIAHVIKNGNLPHYVVIHKITKKTIIIADPASGVLKLTHNEFLGYESQRDNSEYRWTGILVLLERTANFGALQECNAGTLLSVLKTVRNYRGLLYLTTIISIVCTVFAILSTFFCKLLIDSIIPSGALATLTAVSVGMIVLSVTRVLLNIIRSSLLLILDKKMNLSLLMAYYKHTIDLPISFFEKRKNGEVISRFSDAETVCDVVINSFLTAVVDGVLASISCIILSMLNVHLMIIALLMLLIYCIVARVYRSLYEDLNRERMTLNSSLTSFIVESINGIRTVKACAAESYVKNEAEKRYIKLLQKVSYLRNIQNYQDAIKDLVQLVGGTVILWVGAMSVIEGRMTVGGLMAFNALLMYFLDSVRRLMDIQPHIRSAKVAGERIGEILAIEKEEKETDWKCEEENLKKNILFKNVSFEYEKEKQVLKNVSFEILQGQRVAFVGTSGSGKTSIAKLLVQFHEPDKGQVLIGSINIKDMRRKELREKVIYVPQETNLFAGTIYENLVFGTRGVTMKEVADVVRSVGLSDYIDDLPLRYNTLIEENGNNMSGGQKQKLAIARALIKKPEVIILDEATSNLDAISEKQIINLFMKNLHNCTVIFIAHRINAITQCDNIFVMDSGRIVERGKHMELMAKNGLYSSLAHNQEVLGSKNEISIDKL